MASFLNIGTVFALGAMHALEPGHGKTAIASYTLSNRQAKRQLITLVLSMAFSHTFVLLLIGFLVSFVFPKLNLEHAEQWIGIASSLFLMAIGAYMLYKIKRNKHLCGPGCKHHESEIASSVLSSKRLSKVLKPDKLSVNSVSAPKKLHTHKTTAAIGFLSGIVPCPSAIAAFFMAGQSGQFNASFKYILIYVSGFVLVMFSLAALFIFIGNSLFSRVSTESKWYTRIESMSAYVIIAVGMGYLTYNLFFQHSHYNS